MKRKIAQAKTINAAILMAVERVAPSYHNLYNNIINKHIEQKMYK